MSFPEPIQPEELRSHIGRNGSLSRAHQNKRKEILRGLQRNVPSTYIRCRSASIPSRPAVPKNTFSSTGAPPVSTSAGAQLPPIHEYHVYRGELDPTSAPAAAKDLHAAAWKLPLLQIAVAETLPSTKTPASISARPMRTSFAASSVTAASLLESGDSGPPFLRRRTLFPPATPQNLVAAVLTRY